MKEVLPGIWTWSVFNQDKQMNFNGHLVADGEGCVMIDPPPLTDEQMRRAEAMHPGAILVTNRHHTRDAMKPAALWKVRILVHELDAPFIPETVRLGGVYRDGEALPGGLRAITLPDQKSPGETALLCSRAGALIVGDAVIGKPAGSLGLLPADKYADLARARAGLRRLLDFPFESVLVGDGESILRGGRRALEALLAPA